VPGWFYFLNSKCASRGVGKHPLETPNAIVVVRSSLGQLARLLRMHPLGKARGEAQEKISGDAGVGLASKVSSSVNQAASGSPGLRQASRTCLARGMSSWRQTGGDAHDNAIGERGADLHPCRSIGDSAAP